MASEAAAACAACATSPDPRDAAPARGLLFVSADDGIGHYIWDSWQVLAIPRMFVGLTVVTAIGGIAVLLGTLAERRLVPWANH